MNSIEHLARSILLSRYSGSVNMMFSAYFDGSGKEASSRVITVAGSIAPIDKWEQFEPKWQEILRKENIEVFHMTDFASSRGEFKAWKGHVERRRRFLDSLVECAAAHVDYVYAFSIDVRLWRQFNELYALEEQWGRPNVMVSLASISACISHNQDTSSSPIEFVFEIGEENCGSLLAKAKDLLDVEIVPRSKKRAVPCQVADLVGWKHRTALSQAVEADRQRDKSKDPAILNSLLNSIGVLEPMPHSSRAFVDEATFRMWCHDTGTPQRKDMGR